MRLSSPSPGAEDKEQGSVSPGQQTDSVTSAPTWHQYPAGQTFGVLDEQVTYIPFVPVAGSPRRQGFWRVSQADSQPTLLRKLFWLPFRPE